METKPRLLEKTDIAGISLLPDDAFVEIFLYLGGPGTAKCAMVCKRLNTLSNDSSALWRHFLKKDFNLQEVEQTKKKKEKEIVRNKENKEDDEEKNTNIEWSKIYRYILSRKKHNNNIYIPASVMFADDGIAYPGYPPANVFDPNREAWCTSSGVDKNVDLVAKLPTTCLVTGFIAENGNRSYSAPLEKALVFTSLEEPPDLELGKKYNNDETSKEWMKKLIDTKEMKRVERNSRTVMFLQNRRELLPPPPPAASNDNEQPEQKYEPIAAFQFPSDYHDCINTKFQYNCSPPTIAQYVHFKLLNSIHPEHMFSTNIDLLNLTILGVTLPDLPNMLLHYTNKREGIRMDPSYKRIHECRRPFEFW